MMDLERITHPLRLARGSHQPGSGKGCAMNVISYINGDTKITDFPDCSDQTLARLMQVLNDYVADPATGFLSPEDSVRVLDLAWMTVGTAGKLSVEQREHLVTSHNTRGEAMFLPSKDAIYALFEDTLALGLSLAGLESSDDIDPVAVDAALEKIGV